MGEIEETYQFQTLDQLKVLAADELRERIVSMLVSEALTATQIAERLGQPANKIHYHVRELERVGLIRLVERREKGGILEKYFRAVARNYMVPPDLIRTLPPDETTVAVREFLQTVSDGFLRAFRSPAAREGMEALTASRDHIWATREEMRELGQKIGALLKPYESRRGIEGEDEYTVAQIWYRTGAAARTEWESESNPPAVSAAGKKLDRSFAVGVFTYDRKTLERAVDDNILMDLTVLGVCQFMDDVTPDLIDRTIGRFRHKGVLKAPPDVREALRRKEAGSSQTP